MRTLLALIVSCLLIFTTTVHSQSLPDDVETIVFIRHGEKPFLDFGQLNCQGLNRALALPQVLDKKFGKPDYIFAPYPYGKGLYYYVRAIVTIQPTAIRLGQSIDVRYPFFCVDEVVAELLSSKYHRSLIFVDWEHLNIVPIAKKIMAQTNGDERIIPSWEHNDFDSMYVLTITWGKFGPKVKFFHDQEGLDNQSTHCSVVPAKSLDADNTIMKRYVFIPEAEFDIAHIDQLNCQGLNRALALPEVLRNYYPSIDYFILPIPSYSYTKKQASNFVRALTTIEPTIIDRGGLYIPRGKDTIESLVEYLRDPLFLNKTVAIVWPIDEVGDLARALYLDLGGDPRNIPSPVPNHDTIYQIAVDRITRVPNFIQLRQNLENQSKFCPD